MVKKIILVFKTHFGIGFTDLASKVIRSYGSDMLREVIRTCNATADMGKLRYVWTMPAWPLWYVCSHCDSDLKPERDPETGRTNMVPTGEEFTYNCQLAFIAAGFTGCENYVADAFGVELTARGNVADHAFKTNVEKVFVCGDMRRGQSLVVWGLREGRDCAAEVDRYLMGYTNL